jgi:hypothetical protein
LIIKEGNVSTSEDFGDEGAARLEYMDGDTEGGQDKLCLHVFIEIV